MDRETEVSETETAVSETEELELQEETVKLEVQGEKVKKLEEQKETEYAAKKLDCEFVVGTEKKVRN
jgi:hypothetical protein